MSEAITIARPYALAAFEQAKRGGVLKTWSELLEAATAAVNDAQVAALVSNPRVAAGQVESLMIALCGGKVGSDGQNFIKLLIEAHRLAVLPEIAEQFEALRAEEEKSVDVMVSSAFDLNDAQKLKIAAALKTKLGREIRLSSEINKDLLGGIVIRAGDKVIDGSARTRLAEMASALA
ncbi:ATP synthase subunit delta [Ferriphaselus amnicola]|uniref:ATP synthase subunit delta n=1 Tax=Ferriphaselus amnicola TaxID=1188319 RepID=A0A2Z6GFG4_9PROT|nr:F0F1 ATP synthase subunit delta [Ferriphaselus amnicola]BBE52149.1 ATP synthase subunit delta [Ferriphaselus amnicola]